MARAKQHFYKLREDAAQYKSFWRLKQTI